MVKAKAAVAAAARAARGTAARRNEKLRAVTYGEGQKGHSSLCEQATSLDSWGNRASSRPRFTPEVSRWR